MFWIIMTPHVPTTALCLKRTGKPASPRMQSLKLACSARLTDQGLHAVGQALPELRTVVVKHCHGISDAGVEAICSAVIFGERPSEATAPHGRVRAGCEAGNCAGTRELESR